MSGAGASAFTVELLQRQNRELREENEELRETVRQLREGSEPEVRLPDWLPHLTPNERAVLELLASGKLLTRDRLMGHLYDDRHKDPPYDKIGDVWICRLRRKIGRFGVEIVTTWGQGWRLTNASVDLLAVKSREAA